MTPVQNQVNPPELVTEGGERRKRTGPPSRVLDHIIGRVERHSRIGNAHVHIPRNFQATGSRDGEKVAGCSQANVKGAVTAKGDFGNAPDAYRCDARRYGRSAREITAGGRDGVADDGQIAAAHGRGTSISADTVEGQRAHARFRQTAVERGAQVEDRAAKLGQWSRRSQ